MKKGKLNAKATMNVEIKTNHQYFIFKRNDSLIIHRIKHNATTDISALMDLAGQVVTVSAIKLEMDVSSSSK